MVAVCGSAVFPFTAFTGPQKNSPLGEAVLVAGAGALIGLGIVNSATDFHALEAAGLFVYWPWSVIFHFLSNK
jgi:hypothetical protein